MPLYWLWSGKRFQSAYFSAGVREKATSQDSGRSVDVYAPESDFAGMIEDSLPSFWTPSLSKAYVDTNLVNEMRIPKKMTREEKIRMAKKLHKQRLSLDEVANIIRNFKVNSQELPGRLPVSEEEEILDNWANIEQNRFSCNRVL